MSVTLWVCHGTLMTSLQCRSSDSSHFTDGNFRHRDVKQLSPNTRSCQMVEQGFKLGSAWLQGPHPSCSGFLTLYITLECVPLNLSASASTVGY